MKYSFPAFENGFIRAAAASPALRVADCAYNAAHIIANTPRKTSSCSACRSLR